MAMNQVIPGETRVGFIGLGVMGMPMALNVMKAGYALSVFDLNPQVVADIQSEGAEVSGSAGDLARSVDVLITMLPDAPDVLRVALGDGGIAERGRKGLTFVDMSTIDPATSRKINAELVSRGIEMIDCPVARGMEHARAGTLALMVGGNQEVLDRVRPLLLTMAERITHCGPSGNGVAMKLVNNYLSHGIVAISSEAMALGVRAGLSTDLMLEVSGATGTRNMLLHEILPTKAFKGNFEAGFTTRLARKDQTLAVRFAEEMGIKLRVGESVLDLLNDTHTDYPQDDFTSILKFIEANAGVVVRCGDGVAPQDLCG